MAEWIIGAAVALKVPDIIGNLRHAVRSKKSSSAAKKQLKDFSKTVKSVKRKVEEIDPRDSRAVPQDLIREANKLIEYSEARIKQAARYFHKYHNSWVVRFIHFAGEGFGARMLEKHTTAFDVCADWLNVAGTTVVLYAAQSHAQAEGDNLHRLHESLSVFHDVARRQAEWYRTNHPKHIREIEQAVNLEIITRFAYTIVRANGGVDVESTSSGSLSPPVERQRRRLRKRNVYTAYSGYPNGVLETEHRNSRNRDQQTGDIVASQTNTGDGRQVVAESTQTIHHDLAYIESS
ncbi:hypothetical protein GQ53DRAFT_818409 [Thozetella sp. PMI_491]|nr:hypothetical protein GQ53DRAFT_818409 [Thozetella sp. PMI_491]